MTDRIGFDPNKFDTGPLREVAAVFNDVQQTYTDAVATIGSPLGGRHPRGDIDKQAENLYRTTTDTTAAMLDGVTGLVHGDAGNADKARNVFLGVEDDIVRNIKSNTARPPHA
ncbi:hypothetical protein ACIA5C_45030 [Actinoplanes sp. NPDC051343]|uniref:hypothetical protein n=1 Tax=Actinoplanes sp. NPDC051343 TaxID=3363906 RepID=UPI0037BD261E